MQFFNVIFIYLVFGILLAYPILGLIQVVSGIIRYFDKGQSPEHYREIKNYLKLVVLYFIGAVFIFSNPMRDYFLNHLVILPGLYLFMVPLPIAVYKWQISRKGGKSQENDILDESLI